MSLRTAVRKLFDAITLTMTVAMIVVGLHFFVTFAYEAAFDIRHVLGCAP